MARPQKKIRPVKKSRVSVKFKGEQHKRYLTDKEMLEHVRSYMGEIDGKIVSCGVERRTFGNVEYVCLYYTRKLTDPSLIKSYRYQIYNNGIPRSGGEISGR